MRTVLVLGLVGASSVAYADRATVVDVGMTIGAIDSVDHPNNDRPLIGPRITLGWENPLVDMPDAPGYRFAGALVPELVAGSYVYDDHAEGYIGVGLRAELQMGQREQGLLRVSARGAMYLVGRALVIGDTRDPMYEFGFGEYLTRFRTRERVGIELTAVVRPQDHGSVDTQGGGFFGLYIGR